MRPNTLYVLMQNQFIGPYAFGEDVDPVNLGDAPYCKVCGRIIGMLEWLPPFRIKFGRGTKTNKPGDVVFGTYVDFIASQRFKDVWKKYKLSGIIEWRPVEVVGPSVMTSKFYYPRFKPATARPDLKKMNVIWAGNKPPECPVCLEAGLDAVRKIVIVPSTIPEDDLFHFIGFTELLASKRFKKIAEREGLVNVEFVAGEDYVYDSMDFFKAKS